MSDLTGCRHLAEAPVSDLTGCRHLAEAAVSNLSGCRHLAEAAVSNLSRSHKPSRWWTETSGLGGSEPVGRE